MPEPDQSEYNPNIIGFTQHQGPVFISLAEAKEQFGALPSNYKLVSVKDSRQVKKVLNLSIGKMITEKLKTEQINLKKSVFLFFQNWHRDWKTEFGIQMEPFFNLSNPDRLYHILAEIRSLLLTDADRPVRTFLAETGLLRKDVLNSIPDELLLESAERILRKKQRALSPGSDAKHRTIRTALTQIQTRQALARIRDTIGCDLLAPDPQILDIYSDEIINALRDLTSIPAFQRINALDIRTGTGVEFEYATRDLSYLMLGKKTGDCTADKTPFQADRNIENIYWTVFPWILDRNYQILKVYYDGQFVMKVHILPLYLFSENTDRVILAVDAVETITAFRDDQPENRRTELIHNQEDIFQQVLQKIITIADAMGVDDIYAEKFSNTGWVRDQFNRLPEIFLHVNNLIKLDELEDVFGLSQQLAADLGVPAPTEIFMEIQMKNTSLLPSVSKRNNAVKSFAVIRGRSGDGIPMKKIIGI